jgi:hypothetical protein
VSVFDLLKPRKDFIYAKTHILVLFVIQLKETALPLNTLLENTTN